LIAAISDQPLVAGLESPPNIFYLRSFVDGTGESQGNQTRQSRDILPPHPLRSLPCWVFFRSRRRQL